MSNEQKVQDLSPTPRMVHALNQIEHAKLPSITPDGTTLTLYLVSKETFYESYETYRASQLNKVLRLLIKHEVIESYFILQPGRKRQLKAVPPISLLAGVAFNIIYENYRPANQTPFIYDLHKIPDQDLDKLIKNTVTELGNHPASSGFLDAPKSAVLTWSRSTNDPACIPNIDMVTVNQSEPIKNSPEAPEIDYLINPFVESMASLNEINSSTLKDWLDLLTQFNSFDHISLANIGMDLNLAQILLAISTVNRNLLHRENPKRFDPNLDFTYGQLGEALKTSIACLNLLSPNGASLGKLVNLLNQRNHSFREVFKRHFVS